MSNELANREMECYFTYDWISATIQKELSGRIEEMLMLGAELKSVEVKPRFGYNTACQFESGAVLMWNTERDDMHYHLILSGNALNWINGNGMDSLTCLRALRQLRAKITRIDLACDVFNSGLTPTDLSKAARRKYHGRGRTPKYTLVGDTEDGWTIYIGSRASEKFLRIYHKGLEQGEVGNDWIRIELECKGLVAHYLGETLPDTDTSGNYDKASTLIRGMVDFDVLVWDAALSQNQVQLSIPKKTKRDTLKWLIDTCTPSLARVIAENPNEDVIGMFWDALRKNLRDYNIEAQ